MKQIKTPSIATAIGAVVITSFASANVSAQTSPFAMQELSSGYSQFAGEASCGGNKKDKEHKCGEGKCGGNKATKEHKCGEGKCGGNKTKKEHKCGEGKCGGAF